jgi:hypothetical protein
MAHGSTARGLALFSLLHQSFEGGSVDYLVLLTGFHLGMDFHLSFKKGEPLFFH